MLTKLAKLCYEGADLHKRSECLLMAAELFAAPAKLSMPHPQVAVEYAAYSFREFGAAGLFTDQHVLQPSELLHTIAVSTQSLVDEGLYHKALPLATLMEFVASEVTRSKILTVKARLLKASALVELGHINEALQVYKRVLSLKDLPDYGARHSEHSKRQEGQNFQFPAGEGYRNDLSPEADENQAAIKLLLEAVPADTEAQLMEFCSPYVLESLHYLRALFLVRIGEAENVERSEKAELRQQILRSAEELMRASLKRVQLAEEVAHVRAELAAAQLQEAGRDEEKIKALQQRLATCFEKAAVSAAAQKTYYANTEEEMCEADARSQRLSLVLRIRSTLGRVYSGQGLLLESFYILRQGLINFKGLAEGQHAGVENGAEPESKGSFKLPEAPGGAGGAGAPAAAKKGAPPPKDAKGGKPGPADDAEAARREEAGRSKTASAEADRLRAAVEAREKRMHPHMGLWLRTKISIINLLLAEKRYEDCEDAIAVTRLEAQSAKDQLYVRKLQEIEFQIHV